MLAKDEYGTAQAWLKNYGGRPGSGWLHLFGNNTIPDHLITNMCVIAETFPRN